MILPKDLNYSRIEWKILWTGIVCLACWSIWKIIEYVNDETTTLFTQWSFALAWLCWTMYIWTKLLKKYEKKRNNLLLEELKKDNTEDKISTIKKLHDNQKTKE